MRCAWNIQTPITLRGELHKRLACDSIRIENTFNRLAINWWNFISRWDDGKKTKCDENGFISSNSPKPIERENIVGELMWQECPEMIAQMGLRREKMSTTCLINLSVFLFLTNVLFLFAARLLDGKKLFSFLCVCVCVRGVYMGTIQKGIHVSHAPACHGRE